METSNFWDLFKEYLPLLAAIIALSSVVIFGYLLQRVQQINKDSYTQTLKEVLELRTLLKTNGMLADKNKTDLEEIVLNLKAKAIQENLKKSIRPNDYNQIMKDVLFDNAIIVAAVFLGIDVTLYAVFILSLIAHTVPVFLFIIIIVGTVATIISKRKHKDYLQ